MQSHHRSKFWTFFIHFFHIQSKEYNHRNIISSESISSNLVNWIITINTVNLYSKLREIYPPDKGQPLLCNVLMFTKSVACHVFYIYIFCSHTVQVFWDLAEWLERLADGVNAKFQTVMCSIPASSDTVESEGRQMKQCWIKYIRKKSKKIPL
jgi:hypothetical protein